MATYLDFVKFWFQILYFVYSFDEFQISLSFNKNILKFDFVHNQPIFLQNIVLKFFNQRSFL